jgi:hypothetical protein
MAPQPVSVRALAFRCARIRGDELQRPNGRCRVSEVCSLLLDPGDASAAPLPALV